jgi:predicted transcriptional regulator
LARLDARDRRALVGTLEGERQVDIAAALGVTQPAIARRLRDRGALAIHRALQALQTPTATPTTTPTDAHPVAR